MRTTTIKLGDDVHRTGRRRGLSIALWAIQVILAVLFLLTGAMKFMLSAQQMAKQSPLPVPFIHFIGVCEILGGIGLVLPALFRIWPILTPIAACGLVIIMLGATVITLSMGWMALGPLLLGLAAGFVAYGRFRLRPLQPRLRS